MRRPMGLETEYGLVFLTKKGKFVNPDDSVGWMLQKVYRASRRPVFKQDPIIKRLNISGLGYDDKASEQVFWIGASAGKLYGDLGSSVLEYAGPECGSAEEVMWADRGGDRILHLLAEYICRRFCYGKEHLQKILITKNNSDIIRGSIAADTHSYGSHENYEIDGSLIKDCYTEEELARDLFIKSLASILVARLPVVGSGGIFYDPAHDRWSYVISPRAMFTQQIWGATGNKPMISCRWSERRCVANGNVRLHIPVGDSNLSLQAVNFRFSMVNAFLSLWEKSTNDLPEFPLLADPVQALHIFAKDITLREKVSLENGREVTSVGLLIGWLTILLNFARDKKGILGSSDRRLFGDVLQMAGVLRLDPSLGRRYTEWGRRLNILESYCQRTGIELSNLKARSFDTHYCHIGPEGFYNREQRVLKEQIPALFSREEMDRAIWRHRALPRAELRKRFLWTHARRHKRVRDLEWGIFYFGDEEVEVPAGGGHCKNIERYLKQI